MDYSLYLKLFEQSLLAAIKTIYWKDTLISIKPESLLARNILYQVLEKILKLMLIIAIFAWLLKQLDISFIVICRSC